MRVSGEFINSTWSIYLLNDISGISHCPKGIQKFSLEASLPPPIYFFVLSTNNIETDCNDQQKRRTSTSHYYKQKSEFYLTLLDNDIVDWNVNKFHKKANESHNSKSNGSGNCNLLEFYN